MSKNLWEGSTAPDDWITAKEAADIIGVSPEQVRHLARKGVLEARRFGHVWVISHTSASAYAKSDRHPGPKPR